MEVFKFLANRQLAQYNSDDRNINVSSNTSIQSIFDDLMDGRLLTINNHVIIKEKSGQTDRINFTIKDLVLNEELPAYFARSPRELRLQLLHYVEKRKIIPGDIITLYLDNIGSNCVIEIKSSTIYKYVLERKSQNDIRYRVMIEYPEGRRNAQITTTESTDTYLTNFNIRKEEELIEWGNSSFSAYRLENCQTKYIGVPYNTNLKVDCFDILEPFYKR